jgi:hypothetical protein
LAELIATLDPIPGALEQLLWYFGHKQVAEKQILIFSDAGGSGRSYHASLSSSSV